MHEVEMIALSIKFPTQLAEKSQVLASKLGITGKREQAQLVHDGRSMLVALARHAVLSQFPGLAGHGVAFPTVAAVADGLVPVDV
jgi:hypothetical protein